MNQRPSTQPSQVQPQSSPGPGLEGALNRLETDLRNLRIEFERFFSGALQVPPEDFRRSLQDRFRLLRETQGLTAADRFRLSGLEARFNSYGELFNRRLREREEGRIAASAPIAAASPKLDPHAGILVGEQVDPAAAEVLYAGLAQGGEGPRFDLHAFGQYLQRQADTIRKKSDCRRVRFRLEEAGGKVRLKARPIKDEEKTG